MKNSPKLTRAIYIAGGIFIVISAVKVVYSGCKFIIDYLADKSQD